MAQQTAAEAAVMEQAAGKFEMCRDSLDQLLSRLMNELQSLERGWQGRAGTSFANVKEAYQRNQKAISVALGETATAIRTSGQKYTSTDDDAASKVGNINPDIKLNL